MIFNDLYMAMKKAKAAETFRPGIVNYGVSEKSSTHASEACTLLAFLSEPIYENIMLVINMILRQFSGMDEECDMNKDFQDESLFHFGMQYGWRCLGAGPQIHEPKTFPRPHMKETKTDVLRPFKYKGTSKPNGDGRVIMGSLVFFRKSEL